MTNENHTDEEPRFVVSFDMESEYVYKGRTYRVRLGAHKSITRPENFPMMRKRVGTVMHQTRGLDTLVHEFPDPLVVEMFSKRFECPLVGARWTPSFSDVEWSEKQPDLYEDEHDVYVKAYIKRFKKGVE